MEHLYLYTAVFKCSVIASHAVNWNQSPCITCWSALKIFFLHVPTVMTQEFSSSSCQVKLAFWGPKNTQKLTKPCRVPQVEWGKKEKKGGAAHSQWLLEGLLAGIVQALHNMVLLKMHSIALGGQGPATQFLWNCVVYFGFLWFILCSLSCLY